MTRNMRITSAVAVTDTGKSRLRNEDAYKIDNQLGLWIVADGMGGHDYGHQASKIACETIAEHYRKGQDIEAAIYAAHQSIQRQAEINNAARGMGTTVVCLQHLQHGFAVFWAGDSRAYMRSDSGFKRLTTDHSVVQELLDSNIITPTESLRHPKRNLLTNSLGMQRGDHEFRIGYQPLVSITPTAEILLCTDGLTDEISDSDIHTILQLDQDPRERLKHLINAANDAGGRDNITAILVSIA